MAVALTETATEGGVRTAPATEGGVCTAEDTDERTDTQLLRLLLRLSLPPAGATATEENALTGCANLLDELSSPV